MFNVSHQKIEDNWVVFKVSGRLVGEEASSVLRKFVCGKCTTFKPTVIFDLSDLEEMDGIGTEAIEKNCLFVTGRRRGQNLIIPPQNKDLLHRANSLSQFALFFYPDKIL